ncbi:MAG TPA: hypothetical protein VL860_05255, partial [Planctomycetota bacterium]|nr:hypothetical protein [Planctomycetota bacterium]
QLKNILFVIDDQDPFCGHGSVHLRTRLQADGLTVAQVAVPPNCAGVLYPASAKEPPARDFPRRPLAAFAKIPYNARC